MTTLLSSFDQPLPDVTPQHFSLTEAARRAHISGSNTANCEPPISAFQIPVDFWLGKADKLCLSNASHQLHLQRGYMPTKEAAQLIHSEQDVVNASTLHFTHPVNVALNLVHRDDYYRSEVTMGKSKPTAGANSRTPGASSRTPQGTASRSRVDTLYYKGLPTLKDDPKDSTNPMACLEFKRAKALNPNKFRNWIVTSKAQHDDRIEARDAGDTLWDEQMKDVYTILSQATHYALKFDTKFVALFDYHTLILLVMTKLDDATSFGGPFAYMTVLTESKQFRKAFLGFLLSAHQGNNGWNIDRDGKDITIQAGNLGDFTADTSRHNTRPARSGGPVSYQEASSSDTGMDSSQGEGMQLDNIRRGAQNARGPAQAAGVRAPPKLNASSSNLSTSSSTSTGTAVSSRSASTATSAGSLGKSGDGHGQGKGAHPAPGVPATASLAVRSKIQPAEKDAKAKDAKAKDAKVKDAKKEAKKDGKAGDPTKKASTVVSR